MKSRFKTIVLGAGAAIAGAIIFVIAKPNPAPSNTTPPSISGTDQVSAGTLTASTGAWTGNPTSYSYQWQRADNFAFTTNVANIGTNLSTYSLVVPDDGKYHRVIISATNGGGTTPATSAVIGPTAPASTTLANAWVDTTTGNNTCVFHTSPVAYVDTEACSTFAGPYAFMASGGTVLVKCGSYGAQSLNTGGRTSMATFQSETPHCATIQAAASVPTINLGVSDYVAIRDFVINSYQVTGGSEYRAIADSSGTGASQQNDHITIDGNWINVGKLLGGCCSMLFHAAQNVVINNNVIGGSCCGNSVPSSPVPLRIGKPNGLSASCTTEACDFTVTNNLFQYNIYHSQYWPVPLYGTVPEITCQNSTLCHMDSIQIWGLQRLNLSYNRFYGDQCTYVFIEGQANAINKDYDIIGNAFTQAIGCNGGISMNVLQGNYNGTGCGFDNPPTNTVPSVCGYWGGTMNIKFNSLAAQLNINFGTNSPVSHSPGTVYNIVGNYGLNISCGGGGITNVTMNWLYNAWTSSSACSGTDSASVANRWVDSSPAPATTQDMHLSPGANFGADNKVPTSVAGGCPPFDGDGDPRPQNGNCDAGWDERNQ